MVSHNRTRPLADNQPAVISAPTLKGAYKLVKESFGDDAVILGSRTVTKRQALGLGHEKVVEVMVQQQGSTAPGFPGLNSGQGTTGSIDPSPAALQVEVERIEELVASIASEYDKLDLSRSIIRNNPLAETLVQAGASLTTVEKLLTRFSSESGQQPNNRTAALAWMGENLRASNCDWDGFYGCHAFLGPEGAGTSDLILEAAAQLQQLGRRTLVLNVLPEDSGRIRQLQVEASRLGFDAAVIQKPQQLARSEEHLTRYDVVLVDMPPIGHPQMAESRTLHSWLSGNTSFHRHLLVPSTQDPRDMGRLVRASRNWNCDWLGLTRLDQTDNPGKVLDFADGMPLPISLTQNNGQVEIASSGRLLDFILGQPQKTVDTAKG